MTEGVGTVKIKYRRIELSEEDDAILASALTRRDLAVPLARLHWQLLERMRADYDKAWESEFEREFDLATGEPVE